MATVAKQRTAWKWTALGVAVIGCLACVPCVVPFWLADRYPCWRYSNASWCGHFCDDDPCACPYRHSAPDPFGGGPGCAEP